jgi:hypothetical protein
MVGKRGRLKNNNMIWSKDLGSQYDGKKMKRLKNNMIWSKD